MINLCKELPGGQVWRNNKRIKPPYYLLFPDGVREAFENLDALLDWTDIGFKAFIYIIVQRYLKVIMDSGRCFSIGSGFLVQKTTTFVLAKDIYIGFWLNGLYQTQYPARRRFINQSE